MLSQAHWQVTQPSTNPKPANKLALPYRYFFIFLPSLKTKFSATGKSQTDKRQLLNYLLCLTRQLSIPMTRQTNRPVYNFVLF